MTSYENPKPLPDNRVREFSDMPGDRFYFEPGDVASYRGETGPVESVDVYTRQLRLQGWERTAFVSWERCRLVQTKEEAAQPEVVAPLTADDVTTTAAGKKATR